MHRGIAVLLIGVAGLAGYFLGNTRAPEARSRTAPRAPVVIASEPDERPAPPTPPATATMTPEHALEMRLKEKPAPAHIDRVKAKAEAIRAAAQLQIEHADATAAAFVAEEIRRERAFLEDKARGGTMEMLRALEKANVRPFSLVEDPAVFAEHFTRKTDGPLLAPDALLARGENRESPLPDGATVAIPPGVHMWKTRNLSHVRRFPRDLLLQGEGMDVTLLRLEEISTRDEIHSLTFRDLTIDCANDYLTDLRQDAPVTIRLERCRVVRVDMGHGSSVMLAARTAAFYATDCLFEAGFGSSPGSGNLFRVRSGLLARLERCTIRGPFRSVFDTDKAATYVFDRCFFENVANLERSLRTPPDGVRLIDCRIVPRVPPPPGVKPSHKPRPLSDLNPDWGTKR